MFIYDTDNEYLKYFFEITRIHAIKSFLYFRYRYGYQFNSRLKLLWNIAYIPRSYFVSFAAIIKTRCTFEGYDFVLTLNMSPDALRR